MLKVVDKEFSFEYIYGFDIITIIDDVPLLKQPGGNTFYRTELFKDG